jgi:hypothetical protein
MPDANHFQARIQAGRSQFKTRFIGVHVNQGQMRGHLEIGRPQTVSRGPHAGKPEQGIEGMAFNIGEAYDLDINAGSHG